MAQSTTQQRDGQKDQNANQNQQQRGSGGSQVHAHRTAKVVELVGSSTKSFEDAIQGCLTDANQTTRGITGAHVENMSVRCEDGHIIEYKVNVKVAFGIERTERP